MTRPLEVISTELPFHITARCRNRDYFPIPLEEVWEIMEDYLFFISHAYKIEIISFVLMNNHFHLIARSPQGNLSLAMNYFMGETSRRINEKAKVINQLYGRRFHRCIIDSNHYLMHVYKYVYRNPIEVGLCERAEDYPYSTLSRSIGTSRLNFPLYPDTILFESFNLTLAWINRRPDLEDKLLIEKALKKAKFKLPKKNPKNGLQLDLMTELY